MKIICRNCQTGLKIPDHKIASGKPTTFACPKCKKRLNLNPVKNGSENVGNGHNGDEPFDFVEEEGQTALVCESNALVRKTITNALEVLDYQITEAESTRDALKRMRYHNYDLFVINENFDTDNPESNGILLYLERLSMAVRRNMFVALISDRFRTMDNMVALNKSANLIINTKNIDDIGKILSRGIKDNEFFYHAFKQTLMAAGRA